MEEKIIIGRDTAFPLNGLITIPDGGEAPYPAVVFVHGSGPSDMDSKVYEVRPFKDLAAGLAAYNIASIRYDKRTFVHGKQMVKTKGGSLTVWDETIEDAIWAADLLRADPRIDPKRIFIAGLSMGGMLAPRIDVEGGNFAGLIIMAGTPRRLEEVMKAQGADFLESASPIIGWIAKKQMKKLYAKFDNLYDLSDEEAQKTPIMGKYVMAYYMKDMGKKQVSEYLTETTKPVFVMQGDGDFHVSVEHDFNEYQRILQNHANAAFKLYPGLNHVFMPVVYGDIKKAKKEYSKPQHVANNVIGDIADWIHQYER
ncbi:MAG: alpha/beta fold hydrolase [Oscillospiraceae bacterium]|nr:alpha/beta fold hydrolase [Oscillospiraceae bacterium]